MADGVEKKKENPTLSLSCSLSHEKGHMLKQSQSKTTSKKAEERVFQRKKNI